MDSYTYKDSLCIILITAIRLGYKASFDEETLQDYLQGKKKVPQPYMRSLEEEALSLSSKVMRDGRVEEANRIVEEIKSERTIIKCEDNQK